MNPSDLPETYVSRVRAADAEGVAALYAEHALFQGPRGVMTGRTAIRDFYVDMFRTHRPQMRIGRTVVEGRRVVFELINMQGEPDPADPATAIDLIELDGAGLIARFTVFLRPKT